MTLEKLTEVTKQLAEQHNLLEKRVEALEAEGEAKEDFIARLEERFLAVDHFVSRVAKKVETLEIQLTNLERIVTKAEDGRPAVRVEEIK